MHPKARLGHDVGVAHCRFDGLVLIQQLHMLHSAARELLGQFARLNLPQPFDKLPKSVIDEPTAASYYHFDLVRESPVRTLGSWQLLVAGVCGGRQFCGAVRLRCPREQIAEWGRSVWEVAHESIHAFAAYPVAVVGDGRILPFLPDPLVRLVHLDAEVRGLI
jgi:hypothetical protein